jgi:hypothetical protein
MDMIKKTLAVLVGAVCLAGSPVVRGDSYDITTTGLTATYATNSTTGALSVTGYGAQGTVQDFTNIALNNHPFEGQFTLDALVNLSGGSTPSTGSMTVTVFTDNSSQGASSVADPNISFSTPLTAMYQVTGSETDILFLTGAAPQPMLILHGFRMGITSATTVNPATGIVADLNVTTPLPSSAWAAGSLFCGLGLVQLRRFRRTATR